MHYHDLANTYQHRFLEILFTNGDGRIFADTSQLDSQLALLIQTTLAVDLDILAVSRDDF